MKSIGSRSRTEFTLSLVQKKVWSQGKKTCSSSFKFSESFIQKQEEEKVQKIKVVNNWKWRRKEKKVCKRLNAAKNIKTSFLSLIKILKRADLIIFMTIQGFEIFKIEKGVLRMTDIIFKITMHDACLLNIEL